jgi:hypothetical protein
MDKKRPAYEDASGSILMAPNMTYKQKHDQASAAQNAGLMPVL